MIYRLAAWAPLVMALGYLLFLAAVVALLADARDRHRAEHAADTHHTRRTP